ncbi:MULTISPECIES: phage terminase small subunit [Budviciaceae]|uniref:Phage small terminase subunit n=1 Tax=Budvicia aquatica TaxID=82979 RepID=A0A2C6DDH8_9GAMM|nr:MULTISPECIES: phage terminase small subunit [Budviciaceae]PHI29236.1 hypothetical protein CRN84_07835 [Budvicia aquatica]VFS47449.1 Phage small terminase subunit [Budvicia aquatica]
MTSPARRHVVRVSAQEAARKGGSYQYASAYELMLVKLNADRQRLRLVQSVEKKAELKKKLLPEYSPWVAGVLSHGIGHQDDVVMFIMIWRIDTGDLSGALDIAEYALKHDLAMPTRFNRQTACAIAEEVAEYGSRSYGAKLPVDLPLLMRALELTDGKDMPDEVRAKLHKIIGFAERSRNNPVIALNHLTRALHLHSKCGVKKDIDGLEREIRNAAKSG